MATDPQPGDRSVRADDRALFLESLLSAQDRLVILYTGHSLRTDRSMPPAIPVAELLDVPLGTVRSQQHRARADVRRRMADVLGSPPS